jgi:hypothetical protein
MGTKFGFKPKEMQKTSIWLLATQCPILVQIKINCKIKIDQDLLTTLLAPTRQIQARFVIRAKDTEMPQYIFQRKI